MITRTRIHDLSKGEQAILNAALLDRLLEDQTVMVSPSTGQVFGPGTPFSELPANEQLLQLPKTTWFATTPEGTPPEDATELPNFELLGGWVFGEWGCIYVPAGRHDLARGWCRGSGEV